MAFWIVAAVLTALAVIFLLRPLMRPAAAPARRRDYDMEVYRDQLQELDREVARGVIGPQQAEAARAEIARRMLAADEDEPADAPQPASGASVPGKWLALALCVAIPLGALAVYLPLGRPDLPAQPLAARDLGPSGPPPEVMQALANLRRHLEENPQDQQGWLLMAGVYERMGRWDAAADAYRHAVGLSQGDPGITASFGEALVRSQDGQVTAEAQRVFESVLDSVPDDPRARYYLAQARAQAGDFQGALDRWSDLVRVSPADAPWLPLVRQQIAAMAQELGLDAEAVMPEPLPPATAAAPEGEGSDAQLEMARGMVARLAERLEQNPDDSRGWLMLARSYRVLGEPEKAREALASAREAAPDDPEVLAAYAGGLVAELPEEAPLPAEAEDAFRDLLRLEPDSPQALFHLGRAAARSGDRARALDLWQRLLGQLDPGSPAHAELLGRIDALKEDVPAGG